MLNLFNSDKYDNNVLVISNNTPYTCLDIKKIISSGIKYLEKQSEEKNDNVVIIGGNNFDFIIQFFASVFALKNIYLITDKTKLSYLEIPYITFNAFKAGKEDFKFKDIDIESPIVNFFTSGSSGTPKIIKKSLFNLIQEANDIGEKFCFKDKKYNVISTTTMCHLFGLTFHLMTSLCNGLIINTDNVAYPENADKKHSILVSTPAFLSSVPKFDTSFKIPPEYIITAGSKLDENIFKYLEEKSKIIEIYGSTETGVVAYKTKHNEDFCKFDKVKIVPNTDYAEIFSDYMYGGRVIVNDILELSGNSLKIKNRSDRLYKIFEKRVSAEELENVLNKNQYINKSYVIKHENKLACMCSLSGEGKDFLLKNNISLLIKKLKQDLSKHSEIIPQKWRFTDSFPMTQTGKINKILIEHIFNVNLSLPVILDRTEFKDGIEYEILFYKECNFFKGHFPSFKLLPGVVQLYIAKEFANNHFGLNLGAGQWKRIKFSNIIKPDDIVKLKLIKSEKQVSFEYYKENKKYSSGVFLCENVFKELIGA